MTRLLLLAGTAEARQVAADLAGEPGMDVVASLAGVTRAPKDLGVPTRVGGFGGRAGFRDWLAREKVTAVLDATHPFAAEISMRGADVCSELGMPYLQLLRPPWLPGEGDRWVFLGRAQEAAERVPRDAAVLLAAGPRELESFRGLEGRTVFCRRIDPPATPFPFPCGRYIVGRPGRSAAEERRLFERLGIDWLVARNSGGDASRAKLDAAREMGLRVAMIRRPPQPEAPKARTAAEAVAWARGLK